MNSKQIIIGMSMGVILGLIILGVIWFYINPLQTEFTITKGGAEVNNLTACCIEFKDIDYFENYSSHYNVSRTSTVNYIGKKTFCFPEGQNILGFDCKLIGKNELDRGWLDDNCECVEICSDECNVCSEVDKAIYQGQINQGWKCSKYKFGDYIINIEK